MSSRPFKDKAVLEEVFILRKKGASFVALSRKFHCSRRAIRYHCQKNGIEAPDTFYHLYLPSPTRIIQEAVKQFPLKVSRKPLQKLMDITDWLVVDAYVREKDIRLIPMISKDL